MYQDFYKRATGKLKNQYGKRCQTKTAVDLNFFTSGPEDLVINKNVPI